MGLNDPDLGAAYALDAVDDDDALAVEAELLASPEAADDIADLRNAAGEYGAALTTELSPPDGLRDRTLTAALAARAGHATVSAEPREVHRVEAERFAAVLRSLSPAQWLVPVTPPEFAGWTVHDLAVHVTANESLFAHLLGVTDPIAPETALTNEERTAQARERQRHADTATVVAEFEAMATAVDDALADRDLEAEIDWWGVSMRLSTVCIHRGFETWTHADDIRQAVGASSTPPPAPSLAAMSERAVGWAPFLLAAAGQETDPSIAVIELTGPGGGRHVVELGFEPAPATSTARFTLRADVVDYCACMASRAPVGGLRYDVQGDAALAEVLVGALPLLASL